MSLKASDIGPSCHYEPLNRYGNIRLTEGPIGMSTHPTQQELNYCAELPGEVVPMSRTMGFAHSGPIMDCNAGYSNIVVDNSKGNSIGMNGRMVGPKVISRSRVVMMAAIDPIEI